MGNNSHQWPDSLSIQAPGIGIGATNPACSGRTRSSRRTTAPSFYWRAQPESGTKRRSKVAVQLAERWIVARLRHETFFSLAALNIRITALFGALNTRPMPLYRAGRRELLE